MNGFLTTQSAFLRRMASRLDAELCALVPRLVALLLGVWLLLPFETFKEEPGVSPFGPFLKLVGLPVTEPWVGALFLLYGGLGYLSLSLNWWRTRRWVSAFGSLFWNWIIAVLLIRNPAGILWILILPLSFCSMYAFVYGPAWSHDEGED